MCGSHSYFPVPTFLLQIFWTILDLGSQKDISSPVSSVYSFNALITGFCFRVEKKIYILFLMHLHFSFLFNLTNDLKED